MKLAWLCYEYYDVDDYTERDVKVVIAFDEPPKHKYALVKQIVYAEIEDD